MDHILAKTSFEKLLGFFSRWLLIIGLIVTVSNAFAARQPIIISSSSSNYQQSLVQNILANLKETDIQSRTFDVDQQAIPSTGNDLIISIGNKASVRLDQGNLTSPQLRVFTQIDPNKHTEHKGELHLSMIQSVCQQFALMQSLNTEWQTVSVLLSSPNTLLTRELESCAEQYNLTVTTINISEYVNIIDALNTTLLNSDVLLALPDSSIYNARTIKSILLTTYRHRVAVIGFSESFVRAGALIAIHSSTKQLGKQIAELIIKHYNNVKIKKHHLYPEYFDLAINKDVAKSLGITIPDRKVLIESLKNKNNE